MHEEDLDLKEVAEMRPRRFFDGEHRNYDAQPARSVCERKTETESAREREREMTKIF
jgi:hypothetical protein